MNKRALMSVQVIDFYLAWADNYLTLEKIAEHHGLDVDDAKALITMELYMHRIDNELLKDSKSKPNGGGSL